MTVGYGSNYTEPRLNWFRYTAKNILLIPCDYSCRATRVLLYVITVKLFNSLLRENSYFPDNRFAFCILSLTPYTTLPEALILALGIFLFRALSHWNYSRPAVKG
jgi:hypothetical protein